MLSLTAAQLAVWALFSVFLPALLTLLALFVGDRPRQAADTSRRFGDRSADNLRRASAFLRDVVDDGNRRAPTPPRTRVDANGEPPRRVRVDRPDKEVTTRGEEIASEEPERDPPHHDGHDGRRR